MNEENLNVENPLDENSGPKARARRRERAICDALRGFLRDHAFRHYGRRIPAGRSTELELRVRVEPENEWCVTFEPPLEEQIRPRIEDLAATYGVFRRGHVYCFRCASASCRHSMPESPLQVFRGYGSTGVPEWQELVQAFLDGRDERLDLLFVDQPVIVALVQLGRDLRKNQLSAFGRSSKTYAILGQVVAGYWRLPPKWAETTGAERLACTFQAVEIRQVDGTLGLKINPVVGALSSSQWDELLVSSLSGAVGQPLRTAVEQIEKIERKVIAARQAARMNELRQALRQVPHVLTELARSLEGRQRQELRRTRHAQSHSRPERPIHKALEDAREATDTDLFYDEKRGTWIAYGKNGRTHVFNLEGKHVTSFILQPGGVDFRLRTHRWRLLQKEEIARFRACIAAAWHSSSTSNGEANRDGVPRASDSAP
ncbi:MAG: hypothetical protein N2255_10055 [Kiritimatiellae bacterium]|nr:hypothetical protein [Kiritimatiellia bacterium]